MTTDALRRLTLHALAASAALIVVGGLLFAAVAVPVEVVTGLARMLLSAGTGTTVGSLVCLAVLHRDARRARARDAAR